MRLCTILSAISSHKQSAEKARQQRSRVVQTLNVPQGYASGPHSLRPCWTTFLSTLLDISLSEQCKNSFRNMLGPSLPRY
jgi:hypothetical protein